MTSADLVGAAGEHGLADPDALSRPHHAKGMRTVHACDGWHGTDFLTVIRLAEDAEFIVEMEPMESALDV